MDNWKLLLALLVFAYIIFKAYKMKHHFQKWGIPQPSELAFIGTMGENFITRKNWASLLKDVYDLDKEAKYIGCHMLFNPILVLRDLELIKAVLVKSFDHFSDHKSFVDESIDPLCGKNLASLNGDRWREVRTMLTPAFTSSKMRNMYTLMSRCSDNFTDRLLLNYIEADAVNMKDVFARYANDVIASCAFGIEVDSLKDPKNEFYVRGKSATTFTSVMILKVILMRASPRLAKLMGLRFISKRDTDFFLNLIKSAIETREKEGITRPDMLQLMIDARSKNSDLDLLEMTAQAFIFFLGGFDTTSGILCLISHEISVNPEVQEKLQAEIDTVMEKSHDKPTYEAINNMAYLDAVIAETLRMHPVPFLNRMCSKEFEFPPTLPGSKQYIMKPGTEVIIPASAIHRDPVYYENPDKFDPERFINKKSSLQTDVTSLGFGLGPRMCIGSRFAALETKILIVHLLRKCSLVPCKKTCVPLLYDSLNFIPTAVGGFWLKINPRNS